MTGRWSGMSYRSRSRRLIRPRTGATSCCSDIVRAVRQRLDAAERQEPEIALASGEGCSGGACGDTLVCLSAANTSGIVRGASISLSGLVSE